jgi:hypothetical protein
MPLLFCAQDARATNLASDNGSLYQNPWGPGNPQSQPNSGFAPWVFDQWNPSSTNPPTNTQPPGLFFIDTTRGAWAIKVPADINGLTGYDAAWISFTGDGYLDPGQTFSTTVLLTPPGPYLGPYGTADTPTEGIDFFAQSPTVPSQYDTFGHQVIGIYLGPSPSAVAVLTLVVHTTVSDESPAVVKTIPLPFTGTIGMEEYVGTAPSSHF